MGVPTTTTPQEAAPAYDDVVHNHPVNHFAPSGSTSAYARLPQDDDVEQNAPAHTHNHTSPSPAPASQQPESVAQTIAGVFGPRAHVHCERCDVQQAARERRQNERHCCTMVALTFMVGFVCAMVFAVVLANAVKRKHGDEHD